ncbi:MAG: cation diffusion facilitator family transporter [bacterium]
MKDAFTEHLFEYRTVAEKRLVLSLIITLIVMLVELVGGWLTHSIALISDAGHMFTHCFAIGISLVAILVARKPPCHRRTYGLYRAEVLAAFINGLFLLMVVCFIIYEAIMRIIHPEDVLSLSMLVIGLIGLIVNIASIMILHGTHKENLNIKGVFYHMAADAVSSVGIVIAAIVIHFTGWNILDPLVSLGISIVIIYWAWGVLREAVIILLEMAPSGLNVDTIAKDLKEKFPEIKDLYNIHIWTITADMLVFSAHLRFDDTVRVCADHDLLITRLNDYLAEKYRIIESTIQIDASDRTGACEIK